jgi:hypothetical protein
MALDHPLRLQGHIGRQIQEVVHVTVERHRHHLLRLNATLSSRLTRDGRRSPKSRQ